MSNCGLDILLPDELAKIHNERVSSWLDQCYQIHESSYLIKESELVTRQGERLPIVKLFKVCYSIEKGLEFACFLLVQDQPNRMICSDSEMCVYATGSTIVIDSMSRLDPNRSPTKIR